MKILCSLFFPYPKQKKAVGKTQPPKYLANLFLHIVVVHRTIVLNLVGTLQLVVAVVILLDSLLGLVINLHINLHKIRGILGFERYIIEEVAIRLLNASHHLGKTTRIEHLHLLLLLL